MKPYDHKEIEGKWQKSWDDAGIYRADDASTKQKKYVLDMYPYPSGAGLHVGHVEGYTATDIYTRHARMQGYEVLHPMGWDAFGLPAENYAVKTGVPPQTTTQNAIDTFRRQIKALGLSYDWLREVGSHTPEYYQWTQWFFLLLYKNGLAEKKKAKVNWCPSCQTVLANEQVVDGKCERCGTEVVQKDLEQWFFKITEFADALANDLDTIDWPESTKAAQRNWIGRSEGAEIDFTLTEGGETVTVFTTRPDTLFGATYLVLAPEHPLVASLQDRIENAEAVQAYVDATQKKTDLERQETAKEKTGVELVGVKATNPANNEEIPVWIADYVIGTYGTGAIMAVPAHDERDKDFLTEVICKDFPEHFASMFKIVVIPDYLIEAQGRNDLEKGGYKLLLEKYLRGEFAFAQPAPGIMINSSEFDGLRSEEAKRAITENVGGRMKTTYRLRDWLVSRQRYWGAPIPVVYDPEGKPHPIPEEHLPWVLPNDVEFKPTGVSPLSLSEELKERTEKLFGKGWTPEVDTMDTFVCSSWYFFRFADPKNASEFAGKGKIAHWLPVDLYVGGAEHTVLHLLYSRFFTKVLQKLGFISFGEPFQKLRHQGIILAEDGRKMSKSLGNVVNPDDVIALYGADTLRLYEMFMGPLEIMKPWSTQNIIGCF
jgi:leucyl-tRNA synthetase